MSATEIRRAVVATARCFRERRAYGIRTEDRGVEGWTATWAFPLKESSIKREKYDKTEIGALGFDKDYPGCPFCGGSNLALCGACNRLGCINVDSWGRVTCPWCGFSGVLEYGSFGGISVGGDV